MILIPDEDAHYNEVCNYLEPISKEDITKLGVALGLKAAHLKGKDPGTLVPYYVIFQGWVMVAT